MRRQRVLGVVLTVWGAAVIIHAFIGGVPGSGSYRSGGYAALVFAVALIAFGTRAMKRDKYAALIRTARTETERREREVGQKPS